MATLISLKDVVDALEGASEQTAYYLDPETGEILMITEDEREIVEEEDEESWKDYPEWQQETLPKARDFLQNPRTLMLPDQFDIHEWQIMRRFAEEQTNERKGELLNAIHRSGAFKLFKSALFRLGIEQDWYKFRQDSLEEIAREWLEEHKLPYKR